MSLAVPMESLDSLGRVLAAEFEEQFNLVRCSNKGRIGHLAKLVWAKWPEKPPDLILTCPAVYNARVSPQLGDEHGRAAEIMLNLGGLALRDSISGTATVCPLLRDAVERAVLGRRLGNPFLGGPSN